MAGAGNGAHGLSHAAATPAWAGTFEEYARAAMAASDAPGLAVAVSRGGREVYARGFGCRDAARALPATPDTVFGAGSLGKSVTALAVMQLVEAGRLSLDDPVVRYLPAFRVPDPAATASITLHHLLTHTSGLPPLPAIWLAYLTTEIEPLERAEVEAAVARYPNAAPIRTYADLLAFLASHRYRLVGRPGEHFSYSNEGYSLLGAIVERISGLPCEAYAAERIFAPAGMRRTTLDEGRLRVFRNRSLVYRRDGSGRVYHSPNWFNPPTVTPAGLLGITARDLVRLMEMFRRGGVARRGRLLSAEGTATITAPHASFIGPIGYGYGLQAQRDYQGVTLIGHGGGAKGMAAYAGYVPELGLSAAVLGNLQGVPAEEIWLAAVNLELGLPADTPRLPRSPVTLPPARMPALAGRYGADEVERLDVTVEDGALICHAFGHRLPLVPVADDWSVMEVGGRPLDVLFLPDGEGAIRAVSVRGRVYRRI